jgi:hypothetical protein
VSRNRFRVLGALAALVAVVLLALPVLGVDPSATPSAGTPSAPAPSAESPSPHHDQGQGNGGKPDKAAKPGKQHAAEHPVSLRGLVGRSSEEDGDYTLTVGSTVYRLSAGPRWWWGDKNPLAAVVDKTATIEGDQEEGSDEVDVLAIDGTAIRPAGKPPWAGGWKVVGPKHPGWAQWKVDKLAGRAHGPGAAPGLQGGD